jgi:hypothetical protein
VHVSQSFSELSHSCLLVITSLEGFSGICCPLDIRKTEKGLHIRISARDLANFGYRGHLLSLYWASSSSNEFEVNPKDILFEILFFDFCFLVVCDLRLMRWIYHLVVPRRQALERKKTAGMMGSSSMQERQRRVSEAMHYGVWSWAYAPLTSWFPRALRTLLPCHYLWGFPSVSLLGTRLRLLLESIERSILLIKYARSDHKTDFCLRNRNSFTNL